MHHNSATGDIELLNDIMNHGDQAIRLAEHNAIERLLRDFPQVRAVAFNGATAAKAGRKMIGAPPPGVELFDLPSSSAANTMLFADKARAWAVLAPFVAA